MFTSTTIASELKSETKILPRFEPHDLRRALISRFADFWLLGGFSILIFGVSLFYEVNPALYLLLYPVLQITIEFPHLMGSYKIAYSRGPEWMRAHKMPLFLAPALMLALLATLSLIPRDTARAGWETLVALSFVIVGWHRARQTYGCMILYSHFDGYKLAPVQKQILSTTLNLIWIAGYVNLMTIPKSFDFFGFEVPRWEVPLLVVQAANGALAASFAAFLIAVLGQKSHRERKLPSLNFLIPMLALMVWGASALINFYYFVFLTPTFHSLQHLTCVYGYRPAKIRLERLAIMTGLLIASGYFFVRWLPASLTPVFALSFVAINIFFLFHHYILDSIIWRTSDKKVVENLLVLNQQCEGTVGNV